jgi:hypothetical protein
MPREKRSLGRLLKEKLENCNRSYGMIMMMTVMLLLLLMVMVTFLGLYCYQSGTIEVLFVTHISQN